MPPLLERWTGMSLSVGFADSSPRGASHWRVGRVFAGRRKLYGRKMAGAATEDGGSGPGAAGAGSRSRAQSATGVSGSSQLDAGSAAGREMAGDAKEGSSSVNEAATQSENPAVRQFAEVAASDSLTGKTIGLFTPNARTGKTVRLLSRLTV